MFIQYTSDLHLEFSQNRDFIKSNPIEPKGDILLLAGDIVPFAVMHKHADFFTYLSDHFQHTYWVPGNHEYYNSDLAERSGTFHEKIKDNVSLVNNTSVIHDDVQFVFSTLWSKISPLYAWQIEQGMSDFHVIRYKGKFFSAEQFNQQHEESISFIKETLEAKSEQKKIVVSHHIPTFQYYPEQYKGSVLSEAFAVELFDLIESDGPDYWIYGHHHSNVPDFTIGKTKMLTNQLGYVKYGEHGLFDGSKRIEL
jgi:predicted phosphohydrolase